MNSFDILEELGNLDDDLMLWAQEDPPKRHYIWLRGFQKAAAACLICALVFTVLIATDAIAMETGLRWRVRYREDEVTWLFKDGMEQEGELPNYEPTWLPEGCEVRSDYWGPARDRSIGYNNPNAPHGLLWFDYIQITDKEIYYLTSLDKGTYEKEAVEINGLPGELYTFLDNPDKGKIIWIDKHNCIVFLLNFNSGVEDGLRIAESVTLIEEE